MAQALNDANEISTHGLTRRPTLCCFVDFLVAIISTHGLTRRPTFPRISCCFKKLIFQLTASQGGRLRFPCTFNHSITFQLTASQGGRRNKYNSTIGGIIFQLTASQGGRRRASRCHGASATFQLTASQGGRLHQSGNYAILYLFQLTASQGGRRNLSSNFLLRHHFNSRPHKEADHCSCCRKIRLLKFQLTASQGGRRSSRPGINGDTHISTHGLTRRPTMIGRVVAYFFCISTHGLTRRPTLSVIVSALTFNLFQLTASQGGRRRYSGYSFFLSNYFNSRPHKEADLPSQNGRH